MMNVTYILSAIFQGINRRVKNDTPYFNTLMLVSWALFLHLIQLMALIKLLGYDLLGIISKGTYIVIFILFMIFSVLILKKIFPRHVIISTEVKNTDIKKYYNIMISYLLISICILFFLL